MPVSLFTVSRFRGDLHTNKRRAAVVEEIRIPNSLQIIYGYSCGYEYSGNRPLAASFYHRCISTKGVFACVCLCLVFSLSLFISCSKQLLPKRYKVLCVSCFSQKVLNFLFFFPVSPVRLQVYFTMTPLLSLAVLP